MRGNPRKVNSGHNSVPKSARRTEPSPRNPRFAAHLRCVSAKEGKGSQEGTGNHTVSCPLLPLAVGTAFPAGEHRRSPPPKAATVRALRGRKVASTGCAAVSAEGLPSADGIKERADARWGTICKMFTFEPLTQDEKTAYIIGVYYIVIPKHCARCAALSRQRTGESICQQTRGRSPLKDR